MIGRWHRLHPALHREVLVFDPPIYVVGFWHGDCWRSAETFQVLNDVSGWMPLPAKPKEGQS